MNPILKCVLTVGLLAAPAAIGADSARVEFFKQKLAGVPKPELAATAAELVRAATRQERDETTRSVVKAAMTLHRAAAPGVVGAIAQADAEMAPTVAAAAAFERPELAAAVARAAASAAPSKAAAIVLAVCRAAPNAYRSIALAVAQVVPGSGKEILEAVAAAVPGLRPAIDRALAGSGANPSVASVLEGISASNVSASTPGTPTNTVPGNAGNVPPGGRNYAAP